ncbi:MAG: hypothetical protein FJZ79_07400 [Chlorobi bacterium]|nr:hypothetical protein [Chlorobiota bacterium]
MNSARKLPPVERNSGNPVKEPYRNRPAGRFLQIAGTLIGFTGLVFIFGSTRYEEAPDLVLCGLAAVIGGYYLWFRGTRISAGSAEQLLQGDKRDPVVFIRSFGDEERSYRVQSLAGLVRRALVEPGLFNRYFQAGASFWGPMQQFQFNRLFREIGPFIAIGKPGEKIPGMGAARMYVSDDRWQSVVGGFFRKARLVVVQPGTTPGLQWEIQEIKQAVSPEKILFILPEKEADYHAFRSWIDRVLPVSMPEKMPSARFLALDSQWKPYAMGGYRMLLGTLEPYFRNNSIPINSFSMLYRVVYNSWVFVFIFVVVFFALLFSVVGMLFP